MRTIRKKTERRGNALVELVVALPILFILTFGGVEACNLNHLQHCATQSSYIGGLRGIPSGTTETEIRTLMESLLASRSIENATIVIQGANGTSYDDLVSGDKFKVTTTIPSDGNLPLVSFICKITDLQSDRFAQKN